MAKKKLTENTHKMSSKDELTCAMALRNIRTKRTRKLEPALKYFT